MRQYQNMNRNQINMKMERSIKMETTFRFTSEVSFRHKYNQNSRLKSLHKCDKHISFKYRMHSDVLFYMLLANFQFGAQTVDFIHIIG